MRVYIIYKPLMKITLNYGNETNLSIRYEFFFLQWQVYLYKSSANYV